ncbi:MAG: imelysin family protein [Pseudomonadota bacterium]
MKTKYALLNLLILISVLSGCGGGGGSDSPAPPPSQSPSPNPTPEAVNIEEEFTEYLTDLADGIILPRYQAFQDESRAMVDASSTFCDLMSPSQQDLETIRTQWIAVTEAWQAIRFVNVGQVTENNNSFRIQLWPDANDAVSRGVENLLIESNTLTADFISNTNAGGQGIPALEYLLYPDNANDSLFTAVDATKRCELIEAISNNLANISEEIYTAWIESGGNFRNALISGEAPFTSVQDSVEELATNWLETLALTKDERMLFLLGDEAPGRPDRAEHFRSDISLAVVEIKLLTIRAFFTNLDGKGFDTIIGDVLEQPSINDQLMSALDASVAAIQAINQNPDFDSYADLLDSDAGRAALTEVIDSTRDVRDILVADFIQVLDIQIGFNALDGD